MAQTGYVGVFHRADDSLSHLFFIGGKTGVDGCDDIVEFREKGVGKIEFSVFENIALCS